MMWGHLPPRGLNARGVAKYRDYVTIARGKPACGCTCTILPQKHCQKVKAKFHYASWFGAGSKLVRSWFESDSVMEFGFEPASSQLRTSSEPASVQFSYLNDIICRYKIGYQQLRRHWVLRRMTTSSQMAPLSFRGPEHNNGLRQFIETTDAPGQTLKIFLSTKPDDTIGISECALVCRDPARLTLTI